MKQYYRYQMNFDGKAVWLSGVCMGIAIFALVVYYLFLGDITQISTGVKVMDLWLPVGLCAIYIALLRVIRWNAPGVYAILGAVFCLLLIIGLFSYGGVRLILGVAGYILCGAVLILCTGGYIPGRLPAAVCFAAVLLVRLLSFDFGKITGSAWLPEIATLSMIAGLMFLPLGMIPGKKQE